MPSFVNKNIRAFKAADDLEVRRKRSDGRMKTYQSATDARAWCDSTEERRQYILDLVKQGDGKGLSLGKYIPIEAIIDILLANKNADIERLQQENDELKKFIKKHGLTYQEKEKPVAVTELRDQAWISSAESNRGGVAAGFEPISAAARFEEEEAGGPDQASSRGIDQAASGGADQASFKKAEQAIFKGTDQASPKGADQASSKGTDQASSKGTDQASSKGADQASSKGADEASSRGADQASSKGTDQASSKGADQASSKGVKQTESRGADQASSREVDEASAKETGPTSGKAADAASISTKDSRARPPGASIDVTESVASKRSHRSAPASEMESPVTGVPLEFRGDDGTVDGTTPAVVSDTTDNEADKGSSRYGQTLSANEKAAMEFLADKSPEEQLHALKQALADREYFYREQRDIAAAAIEKLENIKDIVEDKDAKQSSVLGKPSNLSSQQPGAVTSLKSDGLDELKAECTALRRRLGNTEGLEDAIRHLKSKAHGEGDSKEKDKLLAKIAALEKELDNLKYKLKEIDILKVERDCLKSRIEDLSKIRKDYEELLKKTQGFEALKAECARYKAKCEELQNLETECNDLRVKVQKLDQLENERAFLMKEIQDCECCMNNQEDEIKRLACHIECLNQDIDKRQDEMKVKVITMKAHLEKKDSIIAKSEEQLASVQDQLRNSIESLSCERSCLHNRIEELEDELKEYEDTVKDYEEIVKQYEEKVNQYEDKIKQYEIKVNENENKLNEYQRNLQIKEESNKALLEKLENEKNTSTKLEESLKRAMKGDEHLKQMSKHAKCAIMCITQKIARHEIVDVAKITAERENFEKKIKELEDQVVNLKTAAVR